MSESVTDPVPPLDQALRRLSEIAERAGERSGEARAEGEALAAAVAEASPRAYVDWATRTGRDGLPPADRTQAFFDAASRGRKWRSAPTALLSRLVAARSGVATEYAEGLATVTAAACDLGDGGMRVVGNASVAAAAQLAAVRPKAPPATPPAQPQRPAENVPAAGDGGSTGAVNPILSALRLTGSNLSELAGPLLRRMEQLDQQRSTGSSLDLGPGDPLLSVLPPAVPSTPAAAPGPTAPAGSAEGTAAATPGAAAQGETQAAAEAEAEPEKSLDELLAELDALTGLAEVKSEIHRQVAVLRVEGLRIKAGLTSPTITRHLVFVGNPGTGKTTVARLVGGIYRALGVLSQGQLVEVDRSELVAGYLGQTAIKTAEVVKSAVGGVLFIDEAYSLSGDQHGPPDQYGKEAIDTLVKEMEDNRDDLVLIVAGYPEPMAGFISRNPGLSSRFRTTIEFADYTDTELIDIFGSMADDADYDVTERCRKRFEMILAITPRGPSFGNARFARNHLEAAIGRHAWRLRDIDEPTLEQLRALEPEDLDDRADDEPADGDDRAGPPDDRAPSGSAAADHDQETDGSAGDPAKEDAG
ncbi:AAA family ATPase [Microlunatus speluncae]|uniref:AAA family ATPase n=1 Tax=Microlunatus speluncae TaxID=2594267 RepID=UPI0012665EFE|nr:AAA family ATPase [Microlunatus speluncae]